MHRLAHCCLLCCLFMEHLPRGEPERRRRWGCVRTACSAQPRSLSSNPTWRVFTPLNPSPGDRAHLGSLRLREITRWGWIYASAIHLYAATPTPRLIFSSSPPLRPPPCAAPPAGLQQGVCRGEDLPATHPRARGHWVPTWLGRDGVRKQVHVPGGQTSRRCTRLNCSGCTAPQQPPPLPPALSPDSLLLDSTQI